MTSQWNANPSAYQDHANCRPALAISLETFPPGNDVARQSLHESIEKLDCLQPEFISVTSGAGGSSNDATAQTIKALHGITDTPVAAHLTCINKTREQVHDEIRSHLDNGVNHFIALRGDRLEGVEIPDSDRYSSALDLVRAIRAMPEAEGVKISVAAYPEGHPEANNVDQEIAYLKRKVEAGANQIVTQFFFDTEVFLSFHKKVREAGIAIPVVPGILPIVNFPRAVAFAEKCGTSIPGWYHVMYRDLEQNQPLHHAVSKSIAVEQCRQLMAFGIRAFHFYTLNRSQLTLEICQELGAVNQTQPADPSQPVATCAGAAVA